MNTRYWSADDLAEIKNARGFNIPWRPAPAADGCDLWAVEKLEDVL